MECGRSMTYPVYTAPVPVQEYLAIVSGNLNQTGINSKSILSKSEMNKLGVLCNHLVEDLDQLLVFAPTVVVC